MPATTTRQRETTELIKRIKRAGWRVQESTDGWMVFPADKSHSPVSVHKTPSSIRTIKHLQAQLKRRGLELSEARMAEIKNKTRTTALSRARTAPAFQAADVDTPTGPIMAQPQVVNPYQEPEDVHITWYAQKHPLPWMRWVWMTGEIAGYLLDNHNQDNRPLRGQRVDHYESIILSGQWHRTHQGMAMDTRGILQDGQHRLQALRNASAKVPNLRVPVAFFVGMADENFKAIDEGLLRTAGQLFAKDEEKNAGNIQTCVRLGMAFMDQNPRRLMRQRFTNERIYDFFNEDAQELRDASDFGVANAKKCWATPGSVAAARYALRKKNGVDNAFVAAYLEGLVTGFKAGTRIGLDETDPRAVVRDHFQQIKMKGKRMPGIEMMSIIVIGWNNIVSGHRPRYMKFDDQSPIPRITVCADSGPNASACPEMLYGEVDEHREEED